MADRVDKILDDKLALLRRAVKEGLATTPVLGSLLPVTRDATPLPYRQVGGLIRTPVDGLPALHRLEARIDRAYEVSHFHRVRVQDLVELPERDLHAQFLRFAQKAQEYERTAVFHLLKVHQPGLGPLTPHSLKSAVEQLGGACRFLGKSKFADDAKDSGVLDDVKSFPGDFPNGTGGMVIPLEQGPLVHRLVEEDLTLTWTRVDGTAVEFELGEQFFLDHPERGWWFSPN